MMFSKINDTFNKLNINFPKEYNLKKAKTFLIGNNIDDKTSYIKAYRNIYQLYYSFNFDKLIFKIEFPFDKDNIDINLENSITILNKFMDICKLKKPLEMKKHIIQQDEVKKEILTFYWNLKQNIEIKTLIEEILFLKDDGFKELMQSIFLIDTKNHIIFNFYDCETIKILSTQNRKFKKVCKKFKHLLLDTNTQEE